MGVNKNGSFYSDYESQRQDFLLGLVEQKVSEITESDIQGFVGACADARDDAEAAKENAATSAANAAVSSQSAQASATNAVNSATASSNSAAAASSSASEAAAYARQAAAHTDLPITRGTFGINSMVAGDIAHNVATGHYAFAEGYYTTASEERAHAEGARTTASGVDSHAEGGYTTASNFDSHAEGYGTTASGSESHAEGLNTIANHLAQHAFGANNIADPSAERRDFRGNYVEIVGNGSNANARSNARTLDWSGNEQLQGALYVGADTSTATLDESKRVLAASNTASAFDPTENYAVGAYTIYSGTLYRCTTAHTGAWDASHFTAVSVGGDIVNYLPTLFAPAGYGWGAFDALRLHKSTAYPPLTQPVTTLNTFLPTGFYYYTGADTIPADGPTGLVYGAVLVLSLSAERTIQFAMPWNQSSDTFKIWVRRGRMTSGGASFEAWTQIYPTT